MLTNLHQGNQSEVEDGLTKIQDAAVNNQNIFEELMETCKVASLGQVTTSLFQVGGQYRRNM